MRLMVISLLLSTLLSVFSNGVQAQELASVQGTYTPVTLTGSVSQQADVKQSGLGLVVDVSTGEPVSNAMVEIPALGYAIQTNPQGRFYLPTLPTKPVLAKVSKAGYTPVSATLDTTRMQQQLARQGVFQIGVKRQQRTVVLDQALHHLGDNRFSPGSAAAFDFKGQGDGPRLLKQFTLQGILDTPYVTLGIGSLMGLDTVAAHLTGQSQFHGASSPLLVKLNGVLVGQLAVNGDRNELRIPARLFMPPGQMNRLEIITGFQQKADSTIDFDDIELMLITLNFD